MDTAKLELAAQRCRDAEDALDAARSDLQVEAVAALREADDDGAHAEVARITGWSPDYVQRLVAKANAEGG